MTAAERSQPFSFRLDPESGIPVYRQLIDQVAGGIASGRLSGGDQLPTVRQVAVDLSINPNTVIRAYRELEIRGLLESHQGTGTFISNQRPESSGKERERQLTVLVAEMVARAGSAGFSVAEVIERLEELQKKART